MKSFISMFFLSKLCGCAGRGDLDARAHIFYSGKQKVDAKVKAFCVSKENCRRQEMIKSIGSDEVVGGRNGLCCDTCNGLDCLGSQLRFEARSVNEQQYLMDVNVLVQRRKVTG